MENKERVNIVEIKDATVFLYDSVFGTNSVVVTKSILQEDEKSKYVQFPQKDMSAHINLLSNATRNIVIKEEKRDEYEQDVDILSAVWCLETPGNVWLNYKFKNETPKPIKQIMSKLFVPENITNNPTGRMCWFINSLCGSSVPVEVTTVNVGEHKKSEFLIPPFPIDKQSAEWIKLKSDIKELDIKIVSKYRF